jgi:hypothetical protein
LLIQARLIPDGAEKESLVLTLDMTRDRRVLLSAMGPILVDVEGATVWVDDEARSLM